MDGGDMMLYRRDGLSLQSANAVYGPGSDEWTEYASEDEARVALGLPSRRILDILEEMGFDDGDERDRLAAVVIQVHDIVTAGGEL